MKACFKCGVKKPLSDFYTHSRMADGHLNKCKSCTKTDTKKTYSANIVEKHAYERRRNQDPKRRAAKKKYEKSHRVRNPEKDRARYTLRNAVRDGRVIKQPCCYCGSKKSQGHHHDYSKPLDVIWACFKCHREREHGQTVTAV